MLISDLFGGLFADVLIPDAVRLNDDNRAVVAASVAHRLGRVDLIVQTERANFIAEGLRHFCGTVFRAT